MADATEPKDFVQRVTIDDSSWTDVTVENNCKYVTVKQLGSESGLPYEVKYRTDGAEDADYYSAGEVLEKGKSHAIGRAGVNAFRAGETIGFFQRATGVGSMVMVIIEHEV